jgi:hypothetical protein
MVSAMILMSLEVIEFSYIQGLNSSIDYRVGIIRGSAFPSELSQLSSFQGLFLLPSPATAGSVWQAKATTLMGVDNGRLPDIEPVPVTGWRQIFRRSPGWRRHPWVTGSIARRGLRSSAWPGPDRKLTAG